MPIEMTDPARPTAEATAPLPDLVLYGRDGCHLCEETRATLGALFDERRAQGLSVPTLAERDIDEDAGLKDRFGSTIPVVELGDRRLELVTSAGRLRRLLAEVLDAR